MDKVRDAAFEEPTIADDDRHCKQSVKPLIGIPSGWNEQSQAYHLEARYVDAIAFAGGIPVLLPFDTRESTLCELCSRLDGFMFAGGRDLSPLLYGEELLPETREPSEKRDAAELALARAALETDKPLLMICRGMQLLNVCLEGTLFQDLPTQHSRTLVHWRVENEPDPMHQIEIAKDTPLAFLLGKTQIEVNSRHHQAIRTLAPSLRVMATSEDDLIEAVYMADKPFVWGVQWHPELLYRDDEPSAALFRAFVDACG